MRRQNWQAVNLKRFQQKDDDVTVFAMTNFRNTNQRFGIKRADRRYHMYILGKTGMGKTTLMETMIGSDINKRQWSCNY